MSENIEDEAEGPVGITDHELVALVDMGPTDGGRRALDAIGILPMLDDEPSLRAGYATLLVRDLAGIEGELIVAQHFANAVAAIMGECTEVVRLVITKDSEPAVRTVFITAPEGAFLLDMTEFGVHAAQPLEPGQDILALIFDVVSGMASSEAIPLPFVVEVAEIHGGRHPQGCPHRRPDGLVDAGGRDAGHRFSRVGLGNCSGVTRLTTVQLSAAAPRNRGGTGRCTR